MSHLLIIEDNSDLREMLKLTLEGQFNLTIHERAESALEDIKSGKEFDLVITDNDLPGMTGISFAGKLLVEDETVNVILISGNPHINRANFPSNIKNFIPKPFKISSLKDEIFKLLNGK